MNKYKYPEGLTCYGKQNDPFLFKAPETEKAIICAAEWLDENPDFQPKFTKLFNVILADNTETVNMTKEIMNRCGIKESDGLDPFFDMFDFHCYSIAVTLIKMKGWDGYIKILSTKKEINNV